MPRKQRVAAQRNETALGIFGRDPAVDRQPRGPRPAATFSLKITAGARAGPS
jgi:hypothetical protein